MSETAHPGDLMNRSLNTGERRTPSALDIEIVQAAYVPGATVSRSQSALLHANRADGNQESGSESEFLNSLEEIFAEIGDA